MNKQQVIKLYEAADRYQDALVAWRIYQAARDADKEHNLCPYGWETIKHLDANVSGWQEANRFNSAAFEAAEAEANRIIAEITAS